MSAIVTQSIEGVNLLEAYDAVVDASGNLVDPSVPGHPFQYGTKVVATDGSEWVFAKVGAVTGNILQYHTVTIGPDCDDAIHIHRGTTPGTAIRGRRPAFYQGATELSARMAAWFMLSGKPTIFVGEGCQPNVALYTTDVSGVLDDAIATGSQFPVRGVFALTSVLSSGSADEAVPGIATFPTIGPIGGTD